MAEQRTADGNGNGNGTVCHILPCAIEEDITAPVAQYFRPTRLPANAMPETNGVDRGADAGIAMAAQFRGRGLLCAVDAPSSAGADAAGAGGSTGAASQPAATRLSALPSTMMGVVLSRSSGAGGRGVGAGASPAPAETSEGAPARSLKVVETFRHVYTWSHEHDVRKVMGESRGSNNRHGLGAALGWCDLAREVHDPIPVPP